MTTLVFIFILFCYSSFFPSSTDRVGFGFGVNEFINDTEAITIEIGFDQVSPNDYAIYYSKFDIPRGTKRQFFTVGDLADHFEKYFQHHINLITPKYYLELDKDCLEFAKSYTLTLFEILGHPLESAKQQQINELTISKLISLERISRQNPIVREFGQTALGNLVFVNIFMSLFVSLLVSYIMKYYL